MKETILLFVVSMLSLFAGLFECVEQMIESTLNDRLIDYDFVFPMTIGFAGFIALIHVEMIRDFFKDKFGNVE